MISEEDKKRFEECKNCEGCTDWHHHCHAECCKIIFIKIDPLDLDKFGSRFVTIKMDRELTPGERACCQYKDVEVIRGLFRFKKERIIVEGDEVMYVHPCKFLEGNLCKLHNKNKPEFCKLLDFKTANLEDQPFGLTKNCLFKYKLREVKQDG